MAKPMATRSPARRSGAHRAGRPPAVAVVALAQGEHRPTQDDDADHDHAEQTERPDA